MEEINMVETKHMLWGAVLIAVLVSLLFSVGDFTGNVVGEKEPVLKVLTSVVNAGSSLKLDVKDVKGNQEFLVFDALSDRYAGFRFFTRPSQCKRTAPGLYNCDVSAQVPFSTMPNGRYYVQAKDARSGELYGNKASFTLANSKYQTTGR